MKHILEYKSFYKEGDIILVEYWYHSDSVNIITPVKILEKLSKVSFRVSHNVEGSEIKNAPDEVIKTKDILDIYRK